MASVESFRMKKVESVEKRGQRLGSKVDISVLFKLLTILSAGVTSSKSTLFGVNKVENDIMNKS